MFDLKENTVPDNMLVPMWQFCTRIRRMCRKIQICHMIDQCLMSS